MISKTLRISPVGSLMSAVLTITIISGYPLTSTERLIMKKVFISLLSIALFSITACSTQTDRPEGKEFITPEVSEAQNKAFKSEDIYYSRSCTPIPTDNSQQKLRAGSPSWKEKRALNAAKAKFPGVRIAIERTMKDSQEIFTSFGREEFPANTIVLIADRGDIEDLQGFYDQRTFTSEDGGIITVILNSVDVCDLPAIESAYSEMRRFGFFSWDSKANVSWYPASIDDKFELITPDHWGGFAFTGENLGEPKWIASVKPGITESQREHIKRELKSAESLLKADIPLNENALLTKAERDDLEIRTLRRARELYPEKKIMRHSYDGEKRALNLAVLNRGIRDDRLNSVKQTLETEFFDYQINLVGIPDRGYS